MVYLGGSWPREYHGKVFMNNIHGQRINMDIPERTGSGYVGKHGPDFVNFNDRWSQIINLRYDQDGSVYLIDWYDKQQCHNQRDAHVHDRSNGRIFKIVYGDKKATKVDLGIMSNASPAGRNEVLAVAEARAQSVRRANEWHARHTLRILQERPADADTQATLLDHFERAQSEFAERHGARSEVKARLLASGTPSAQIAQILATNLELVERPLLRLLWALHVTGGLSEKVAQESLMHGSEHLRSWAIQLLCEDKNPSDTVLKEFARMAKEDPSPMVRLYLASAMQRTPVEKRMPVLEALLARAEDADDHNLPLMYWYAAEPVVGASTQNAVKLLAATKIPKVREYITRRMTAKPVAQAGQ
jgi:hypothetical protein